MKWLAIITASLLVWGCTEKTEEKVEEVKTEISLPSTLFTSANIDGAIPVLEARKLKAGDKVTVSGKIMGNRFPFVESRASFILGDPKNSFLVTSSQMIHVKNLGMSAVKITKI